MTAPLPTAATSPTAGLFNALVRHTNRQLRARIGELTRQISDATNARHELRTARDFADSDRSGFVDRTGLEEGL